MDTSRRRTEPKPSDTRRARAAERTRQDILDAAARVFASRGYHAATMQLIAREAGFTAASLYTYFPGKESIYAGLVEAFSGLILATFDLPEPRGLSFPQRLELLLQRQLRLVAEHAGALRLMFDVGPPQVNGRVDASPRQFLERSARFFEEAAGGALRLTPAEAAALLHGVGHALMLGWLLRENVLEPEPMAARMVDLFLRGAATAR